ncbi:MAG: hypothetical protein GWN03_15230 [Gammaproteobacteria bacterium]|nr:hypothetical protein [Gammaproteobacteria bacterium]
MPKPKLAVSASAGEALSLPALCTEAADHVARAHLSLHDQDYDAERALTHLDEAIDCLKRLLAKGRNSQEQAPNRLSA